MSFRKGRGDGQVGPPYALVQVIKEPASTNFTEILTGSHSRVQRSMIRKVEGGPHFFSSHTPLFVWYNLSHFSFPDQWGESSHQYTLWDLSLGPCCYTTARKDRQAQQLQVAWTLPTTFTTPISSHGKWMQAGADLPSVRSLTTPPRKQVTVDDGCHLDKNLALDLPSLSWLFKSFLRDELLKTSSRKTQPSPRGSNSLAHPGIHPWKQALNKLRDTKPPRPLSPTAIPRPLSRFRI